MDRRHPVKADAVAKPERFTIEELTVRSNTSTRNVRAFQTRGLLHGPSVVGRRGFYDASHVERIALIRKLQERGYKLAAIASLLKRWEAGGRTNEVLELQSTLLAPMSADAPASLTAEALAAQVPFLVAEPAMKRRAERLGLFVAEQENAFRVPSTTLLRMAIELHGLGLSGERILDELAALRLEGERLAAQMRGVFQSAVFEPFAEAGFPPERLPAVTASIERMRALAVEAIVVVFNQSIDGVAPGTDEER